MGGFLSTRTCSSPGCDDFAQKSLKFKLDLPLHLKIEVLKKLNDKSFMEIYRSCWEIHNIFESNPKLFRYSLSKSFRIHIFPDEKNKLHMVLIKESQSEKLPAPILYYLNRFTLYLHYFKFLCLYIEAPNRAEEILKMNDPMLHKDVNIYRQLGNEIVSIISVTGIRGYRIILPSYFDMEHVVKQLQPEMVLFKSAFSSLNVPKPETFSKVRVFTARIVDGKSAEAFFSHCCSHVKLTYACGSASKEVYSKLSALQKNIIQNKFENSIMCEFKTELSLTPEDILATFQQTNLIRVTQTLYLGVVLRKEEMVRTYSINALTQSSENIFNNNVTNPRRGNWNQQPEKETSQQMPLSYNNYQTQTPPEDPRPPHYQTRGNGVDLPPIGMSPFETQLRQYNVPNFIHSPYVDPVGSIVGLRVVYSEGKIAYVPVEPHINYLINQQFGAAQFLSSAQNIYQAPNNFAIQNVQPSQQQQATRYQEPIQQMLPIQQEYRQQQQHQQNAYQQQHSQKRDEYKQMGNLPNRVDTPQNLPPANNEMPKHNVRKRSDEMNDFWFPNNPQPRSGVRRSKEWRNEVDTEYNPWGRGGGGSPLRDSMGNLVTDRRVLGRSWSTMMSTNLPHSLERRSAPYSLYSNTYTTPSTYSNWSNSRMPSFAPMSVSTSMPNLNKGGLSDADQHRAELARQIEDNRRRKEIEKQKEKEEEEREMRKHEAYMAKIRREDEEERRKQKEKAMIAERRSQQIAYEQQERARQARRQRSPPPQQYDMVQRPQRPDSGAPRELEWWEKKPTWQQKQEEERKSAVIPTLRGKPPRTPSAQRSISRHSIQRYDPTSSIQEHFEEQREQREREESARSRRSLPRRQNSQNMDLNESFRKIDATEENLKNEQQRVHDAIRANDYGNNVFNDVQGRTTAFTIN